MKSYEEILNESITSWNYLTESENKKGLWYKIKRFFASGNHNIPEINNAIQLYYRQIEQCKKYFPHSSTNISIPTGRRKENDQIEKLNINTFKENPKQVICLLEARYKLMKFIVDFLGNKKVSDICGKHKYPEKCREFTGSQYHSAKRELESAKQELEMIKKHGQDEPTTQFSATLGRLKNIN